MCRGTKNANSSKKSLNCPHPEAHEKFLKQKREEAARKEKKKAARAERIRARKEKRERFLKEMEKNQVGEMKQRFDAETKAYSIRPSDCGAPIAASLQYR